MRKHYTVEGDINSKKAKDAYPKITACDNCIGQYVVINEGERTFEACEKCGADE